MRSLVTGGAGFIGSHLVDRLVERGDDVLVVDDLSTGHRRNLNSLSDFSKLDIREREFVSVVRSFRPEAIFHLAAQSSVAVSVKDPVLDASANVLGAIRVAEAARESGCDRIVYTMTGGALYGETARPAQETCAEAPGSPYGLSKLVGERYLRLLFPGKLVSLRLANVYGPRQDPHGEAGVVAIFARKLLEGQPVTIFGDGEQVRDFVYVADVVQALLAAEKLGKTYTLNVGTGVGTSVNELVRKLEKVTGKKCEVEFVAERAGDLKRSVLDSSLAGRELGWRAATELEVGLSFIVNKSISDQNHQCD